MLTRRRVGVCGFGIAGGAVSALLARAGHEVTLLERAPALGPVGAGFLLQASGQRVLAGMGLLETIVAQSARIARIEARTAAGRTLSELHYAPATNGGCAYGVPRTAIFDALRTAATDAGVRTILNAEICAVEEDDDAVRVRDAAGRTHGPFDVLIGADGSRSMLRHWLNPHARRREYEYGAFWGSGASAWPVDSLQQVADGTRRLLGLLPLGGGRAAFFWGVRRDEIASLHARGFPAFRAEAAALCQGADEVLADLGSFDRLTFAGYLHSLPRHIHSARVVLAGDAAHAMSPHLGQGANLALLDAECLARQLDARPLGEALRAYAAERRPPSRYFSLLSRVLSPSFQSDSALLGHARDLALPLLCSVPWFRRQMEQSVAGVKQGFFDRLI